MDGLNNDHTDEQADEVDHSASDELKEKILAAAAEEDAADPGDEGAPPEAGPTDEPPAGEDADPEPDPEPDPDEPTAEDLAEAEQISDPAARTPFIKERIKNRKEKRELAAENARLKQELEESKTARPAPPADPAGLGDPRKPARTQAPELDLTDPAVVAGVFRARHQAERILAGDIIDGVEMTDEQAQQLVRSTNAAINRLPSEQTVATVVALGRQGRLGDASEDIARAALAEMPVVQTRSRAVQDQHNAQLAEYDQALGSVYESWPEVAPPAEGKEATPEFKFAMKWIEDNVGTAEKPGEFFSLAHGTPAQLRSLFRVIRSEHAAKQTGPLKKERDTFRQQIENDEQPLSSGAGADGSSSTTRRKSDQLRDKIIARTPGMSA